MPIPIPASERPKPRSEAAPPPPDWHNHRFSEFVDSRPSLPSHILLIDAVLILTVIVILVGSVAFARRDRDQ